MSALGKFLLNKRILLFFISLVVCFIILQFIGRPQVSNPPVITDFQAPDSVKDIFKRACYDCHSNETKLRWYDKIAPVSWQVAEHIKEGRKGLNFSNWKSLSPTDRQGKLWEAVNQIAAGAMPIRDYELVHPSSKISKNDLNLLKKYVLGMVTHIPGDSAGIKAADKQYQQWQTAKNTPASLPQALNGVTYIPDYKNWQAISTTERFDNGTMRVIFGNAIAVKAIQEGHLHPWPNGTIFAKVAWEQLEDKEGNVSTGVFKQIEYMIKDDKKYAATKGWGWARFKTPQLVPYGKDVLFTTECINCHQPMSDNDFVFTLPVKH